MIKFKDNFVEAAKADDAFSQADSLTAKAAFAQSPAQTAADTNATEEMVVNAHIKLPSKSDQVNSSILIRTSVHCPLDVNVE